MSSRNEALRRELLQMVQADERLRSALIAEGSLSANGYQPRMAEVHDRNAQRLAEIITEHGWPARSLVGRDGAEAAWLILEHGIGKPELLRSALPMLQAAVAAGQADPIHAAHLEDRIAFFEDRPQRFGTQFDWDENGELSPWLVEDPEAVDDRRTRLGLPPLAEQTVLMRGRAHEEGEAPPEDWEARREQHLAWARAVGWIR